jgi:GntR family transcriptional regulator, rspAB operon transcriptional repressor
MTGRLTIADEVYARLRHDIVRMVIRPGETLSEAEIAARFGVSRQPVREAFIHLADDGFLLIRPQRPTVVKAISEATVLSAQFIREAVEAAVVTEAANRWTPQNTRVLSGLIADQEKAAKADDRDRFHQLDDAFHREIADCAGRLAAWDVIDRQKAEMDRVRFLSLGFGALRAIAEHRVIAVALDAQDAAGAAQAMRAHLSAIRDFIGAVRTANPTCFADPAKAEAL